MAQNTEKPANKNEIKKQVVKTPKPNKAELKSAPVKEEVKTTETKKKAPEVKKPAAKKPVKKNKKTEVAVNARSVPISRKYAMAICKFIKFKTIEQAIKDLEQVIAKKKAVPMKGEIPHRKGRIMSGRFPKRASENFIILLNSLRGNATNHEVEEPIISEAIANVAQRPHGRFGAIRKKKAHVTIIAKEKKQMKRKKSTKLKQKKK
jgi:ribosomal protein L22